MSHQRMLRERDITVDWFIKAELMSAEQKQGKINISI